MEADRRDLGPWHLDARLGRGATAAVWRATHDDGSTAAVKFLHRPDPRSEQRLRRESHVLAALAHPNIVAARELIEHDGELAVVMELVDGPPLREWAHDREEAQIVDVFMGVLEAMQAAHRAGVIHRDLKPSNVLLTQGEHPVAKVADFGIARRVTDPSLTATGAILGTPAYMAPEQVEDPRGVGPSADVFSLGATLYELICGRPPFSGASMLQVLDRSRQGLYADPAALVPEASAPVIAAIRGALEPDPHARIPDVSTLRDVLLGVIPWAPAPRALADATWDGRTAVELVGRDELVGQIRENLDQGHLVTLVGPIGVGKSAVARAVAAAWGSGARAVDLSEAPNGPQVFQVLAEALGCALAWTRVDELADAVTRALPNSLLVLDGLSADAFLTERIQAWHHDGARLLITAAAPLGLPDEHVVAVEPLTSESACRLLRRLAPLAGATDAELTSLVDRVGALPLALEVIAPMLERASIPEALESWSHGDQHGALTRAVARAFDQLPADEREVCAQLSVFVDGFRPDVAEAVVALPDAAPVRPVLRRLRERHLLTQAPSAAQPGRSRLRMYPHVGQVAAGVLGDRSVEVQQRLVAWAASLAQDPESWLRRGADQRLSELHAERATLKAAHDSATGDARARIARALREVYAESGPLERARRVTQEAWGDCTDHALWVELHACLCFDRLTIGDVNGAREVVDALKASPRAAAFPARVLATEALVLSRSGQIDAASARLRDALQHESTPTFIARAQRNLAHMAMAAGRIDDAKQHLADCRPWFESEASLREQAFFLIFKGELQFHLRGDYRAPLERAVRLFRRVGLHRGVVLGHRILCTAFLFTGRIEEAAPGLDEMVTLSRRYGWREREALAHTLIAWSHQLRGQLNEAVEAIETARHMVAGVGGTMVRTEVAYMRSVIALACGDPVTAEQACRDALSEGQNYGVMALAARCAAVLGDDVAARGWVERAATHDGPDDERAVVAIHLAYALEQLGDVESAATWACVAAECADAVGMGPGAYVQQQLAAM